MTGIPLKLRREMAQDPFYRTCALWGQHDHVCAGKVTWEHALIYAGKQIQRRFAIIPLCEKAHAVNNWQDAGTMKKELNVWVALNRATRDELREISKAVDYEMVLKRLNSTYGPYMPRCGYLVEKPVERLGINCEQRLITW